MRILSRLVYSLHYGKKKSSVVVNFLGGQLIRRLSGGGERARGFKKTTMAAEIHSRPQSSRPVLLNKIEGHQDAVNAAVLIPKEDGVITVSEDRSVGSCPLDVGGSANR